MGSMENDDNPLVRILSQQREQIAACWVELIKQIPDSHYHSFRDSEILESCLRGIDALLELRASGSVYSVEEYVKQISHKRLEQGFDIREVIQALLLLHRAVILVVTPDSMDDPSQVSKIYLDLESGLRLMVSQFGFLYSSGMNKSLEDQRQQARSLAQENARLYQETQQRLEESLSLQRVISALLQERTLDEVLEVVCSEALNIIGARGSTVFLLEEDGCLHVAYSLGYGEPAFQTMPVQDSFTGIAVTSGRAIFTNQPQQEALWFGEIVNGGVAGRIHSLLAAPLIVKSKIIGALVVINKDVPFDQDDLRVMGLFADQAAIAIENGRLTQEVEQVAVMEERNRLARDLHDSVTQSLYGISLYAEAAARHLTLDDRNGADKNLQELRKTAFDALKEMRLLIFELRPPLLEKEGLAAALQARLDAVEGRAGLKTELHVEISERLPGNIEEGFYRIAQEALNNVLKHAQARRVLIEVKSSEQITTLEISDDGVGFVMDQVQAKGGIGITSMFERAKRMGGKMKLDSTPRKGTYIKVEAGL